MARDRNCCQKVSRSSCEPFTPTSFTHRFRGSFTGLDRVAVEREFANEVQMMQHLGGHPNLVLLVGISYEPLAIVFEYLPFSLLSVRWFRVVCWSGAVAFDSCACVFPLSELINGVSDPNRRVPPFPTSWTKRVSMMVSRSFNCFVELSIINRVYYSYSSI